MYAIEARLDKLSSLSSSFGPWSHRIRAHSETWAVAPFGFASTDAAPAT